MGRDYMRIAEQIKRLFGETGDPGRRARARRRSTWSRIAEVRFGIPIDVFLKGTLRS